MAFPTSIEIGDVNYLIEYNVSKGLSSSVRIKGGVVVLRLSRFLIGRKREKTVESFLDWARNRLLSVKGGDFVNPVYEDAVTIVMHNKTYFLNLVLEDRNRAKVDLIDGVLTVFLSDEFSKKEALCIFQDKVEKKIMQDQLSYLKEVLHELNELYFKESYNEVRFKRVSSRFGSCSSKRNINIAFRLLFAPREVFRYVCVHELAHLKEFNHSRRFWEHVENACPDYKAQEKWLKTNGFLLG